MMMKRDIFDLIDRVAAEHDSSIASPFVAPCVPRGRICVKLAGIVVRLRPSDPNFEGWGRFSVESSSNVAKLEGEAPKRQISSYLSQFPKARFRLCFQGIDSSWAALPRNRGSYEAKFGSITPVAIRLVDSGTRFHAITARYDGSIWWYEGPDRSDIPAVRVGMTESYDVRKLRRISGLSAEDEAAFKLAIDPKPVVGVSCPPTDEDKIRKALERGGGKMLSFVDRGDFWNVEWKTGSGRRSSSSIMKSDMTVMSAGMCLSGRDNDFDLQTLVDVVERRDDGM
jgi:hypothetical protein